MKNNKLVALVKGKDRKQNIFRALELIAHDLQDIRLSKNILIKPNLADIKNQTANTHVKAVEGAIEFLQSHFPGKRITDGESSGGAFYQRISMDNVIRITGLLMACSNVLQINIFQSSLPAVT